MMPDKPESLLELLKLHLGWYPLMEPRDVYKLLYQGVMGSEHLLASQLEFIRYLRSEFEPLKTDPGQILFEPIRTDGKLFRVNLRSYKSRWLGLDSLFSPLIETAQLITGTQGELRMVWQDFIQLCTNGQFVNFKLDTLQQFSCWLEQIEFSAVHHSEVYEHNYQPAYRLISARFIPALGLTNAG